MLRRTRILAAVLAAAVAGVTLASCSNSTSSSGLTPQQMQGNYTLTSFTAPPNPTLGPPLATGTLALTLTNWTLVLNITGSPTEYDGGTYTIDGNTFSEHSDSTGFTYNGTATLVNGDSLTVDVLAAGVQVSSTWHKN